MLMEKVSEPRCCKNDPGGSSQTRMTPVRTFTKYKSSGPTYHSHGSLAENIGPSRQLTKLSFLLPTTNHAKHGRFWAQDSLPVL
mmetsp:Transcript_13413/g.30477  ORF Transcript_13413/g.30477 Transcript_13413/m.30477 type:complete len:84 (+) Transcript_13413:143-394(+)